MPYGEIIRRLCPDYLAMGMTLTEFYDSTDLDDYAAVREAHRLRLKQANFDAWLHGLYTYNALICASPLFRDWVKDHHPEKYLEEPFDIYKAPSKERTQSEDDAKELANQEIIKAWVARANRLRKQKQEKEGIANG